MTEQQAEKWQIVEMKREDPRFPDWVWVLWGDREMSQSAMPREIADRIIADHTLVQRYREALRKQQDALMVAKTVLLTSPDGLKDANFKGIADIINEGYEAAREALAQPEGERHG